VDEDELRANLRATMTMTPPPPMASAAAVAAGHRAVRRRATWAVAGLTAVLVAATSVAAAVGLHSQNGPMTAAAGASARVTKTPSPADTKPSWPADGNGQPQEDATARSGARYEQGVKLLSRVTQSVPAGWTLPTGKTDSGLPLQDHQAEVEGDNSGDTWSYLASAAVAKSGRTGRLLAEVHTPGNGLPAADPCALARTFWSMGGDCQVVTAGSAKVGVVVKSDDDRIDQWAAYRYSDGTVVYVAQSRTAVNGDSNLKPLTKLPLTVPQLAALAADPKFHLR
jgi:hypothetical protein